MDIRKLSNDNQDPNTKKTLRILQHNHKDFPCDFCEEWFMVRDDSCLNICFGCQLMLCDECFKNHYDDKHRYPIIDSISNLM